MGLNVGGIYVRADRVTQQDVVDAIREYWLKLSARPSSKDPLDFEALSLGKTGQLALAIAPPLPQSGGGSTKWIAIYDSERYRADSALARHLARHFGTDVWYFEVADTVNDAFARRYGKKEESLRGSDSVLSTIGPMPHAFLYFNKLREELSEKKLRTFRFLAFEGISHRPKARYSGPDAGQLASNDKVSRARKLAEQRDAQGLRKLARDHQVFWNVILPAVQGARLTNPKDARFVHALGDLVLKQEQHSREVAEAALRVGDEALFEKAMAKLEPYQASLAESHAVRVIAQSSAQVAFRMLEAIARSPAATASSWNSALSFLLQVKDPGLPPARIESLLASAKAVGPATPSVFHNLARVLVRLKRRDEALEAVANAVRYGYEKLEVMRADPDLAPLRKDKRFARAFEVKPGGFSLDQLSLSRTYSGTPRRLVSAAVGLHLYFEGDRAAPQVAELLEAVAKEFPDMFAFYGGDKKAPKGKLARDLTSLRRRSARSFHELLYSSSGGEAGGSRAFVMLDEEMSGEVSLYLPLGLAEEPDALFERLVRYAWELPFVSGNAGLSLMPYEEGPIVGPGSDAEEEIARMLPRFVGLTTSRHQSQNSRDLSPAHVSPNWITFLGEPLLEQLDPRLEEAIAPATCTWLPHGLALRAAPRPFVGTKSHPEDLGALPEVVRALRPLLPTPDGQGEEEADEGARLAFIASLR